MKSAMLAVVSAAGVSIAFGAAGCECTVNTTGGAQTGGAQASATPPAAPPPPAAQPVQATAATPPPPPPKAPVPPPPAPPAAPTQHAVVPIHLGGGTVPVIHGSNAFGNDQPTADSIPAFIYFIPENTQKLPDLGTMKPEGALYAKQINVPDRDFNDGFPGVNSRFEWFALRYAGKVTAPKAGDYVFRVVSDDGTILWLDGKKVFDNDGIHPAQEGSGKVTLTAGQHDFRLDYFQGPRWRIALQLWVTPPGGAERLWTTNL
jgi:hypothetical protein